jgi:deoxyribodipyrimidine photolyase-related protein
MKEATIIYPHQLFLNHPAIKTGRPIFLVEEPLLLTEFPTHNQKLLLHRLSLKYFKEHLEKLNYEVTHICIAEVATTEAVFEIINSKGYQKLHIVDTTDFWLEKRIATASAKFGFTLERYESPLFILPAKEAVERYQKSKKHMARFYKQLRQDKKILLDESGEPAGGKWSFDDENQKKLPKGELVPADPAFYKNIDTEEAVKWLGNIKAETYGDTNVWLPYSHEEAEKWLTNFLQERFNKFGKYEDSLSTKHMRLFHSTISPLLNIGLLTPDQVIRKVLEYGKKYSIELNNLEGLVRQIIGWREFIRASYECDGTKMRTTNFWKHTNKLSNSFWNATTNIMPIDLVISTALKYGYNHHIERLMVLGNFMLLSKTHPDEVYRWFMAMYVDAYDWVMVPNVYAMSQYSDGGIFATKPYISGSNYLKKMSDYPSGDWEELWTALYWNFIGENQDFFLANHRLSMMPRLLQKMVPEKKERFSQLASEYFKE